MPKIDYQQALNGMVAAARGVYREKWPGIKDYAEAEFARLARTLVNLETLRAAGQIEEAEAGVLLQMQMNTAQAVMQTREGVTPALVASAIDAALAAVRDTVNAALDFELI